MRRTDGARLLELIYDALGNLLAADLVDGAAALAIEYAVDGLGRRVARYVDGAFDRAWFYQDQVRPARARMTLGDDLRVEVVAVSKALVDGKLTVAVEDVANVPVVEVCALGLHDDGLCGEQTARDEGAGPSADCARLRVHRGTWGAGRGGPWKGAVGSDGAAEQRITMPPRRYSNVT